jgi:hypothetical protein
MTGLIFSTFSLLLDDLHGLLAGFFKLSQISKKRNSCYVDHPSSICVVQGLTVIE